MNSNTKWKQDGITVAGGNGAGDKLNQLYYPFGLHVDDNDQRIYIAEWMNHRIVEWKLGAKNSQLVAGGNGEGNLMSQLHRPVDIIVDRKNDSLIISDYENKRVVRWSRRNSTNGETLISDIDCWGLTLDNNGDLYVSDCKKNEVRRWEAGSEKGTIVAGGNGKGNGLNQLHCSNYIFVDEDHSVYVSDQNNHRVMKWVKGTKEGIVIAGGQGQGDKLTQLSHPRGVFVDKWNNVYVTDSWNHRIMRWPEGLKEGSKVVGNRYGNQPNQLSYPASLLMDGQGHLYVADSENHRVQKFVVDRG